MAAASQINASVGEVKGVSGTTPIQGIDPRTISKVWKPEIKKGPANVLSTLGPRDAVLVDDWAKGNKFDVGDTLRVKTPAGNTIALKVRGRVDNKGGFFDSVTTTTAAVRRDFRQPDDDVVLIKTAPGADVKAVQARIDKLLDARYPVVRSQDQQQFKDDIASQVNQLLALIYALLSLSIIVSLFGIVNTSSCPSTSARARSG